MIDPEGPVPVYLQLVEILADRIKRGELAPNRPLPSEATLQQEYGLARGTVRHAMAVLRERGLAYTVPHRGTYVATPGRDDQGPSDRP